LKDDDRDFIFLTDDEDCKDASKYGTEFGDLSYDYRRNDPRVEVSISYISMKCRRHFFAYFFTDLNEGGLDMLVYGTLLVIIGLSHLETLEEYFINISVSKITRRIRSGGKLSIFVQEIPHESPQSVIVESYNNSPAYQLQEEREEEGMPKLKKETGQEDSYHHTLITNRRSKGHVDCDHDEDVDHDDGDDELEMDSGEETKIVSEHEMETLPMMSETDMITIGATR
nr:hypothetical protein [Tanacetum cinerariifolium]